MGKRARKTADPDGELTEVDTDSEDDQPVRLPRQLPVETNVPINLVPATTGIELICMQALEDGVIPFSIFPAICDKLYSDPLRASAVTRQGKPPFAFTSGAYYHAGSVGLRRTTRSHPWTTSLLATMVRACSTQTFTAVALSRNIQMKSHADKNNLSGSSNIVIPCSKFRKGHLWLEHPDGNVPSPRHQHKGKLHRLQLPGLEFDPYLRHATTPWKDDRIILTAYTTSKPDRLHAEDRQKLEDMTFALPPSHSTVA